MQRPVKLVMAHVAAVRGDLQIFCKFNVRNKLIERFRTILQPQAQDRQRQGQHLRMKSDKVCVGRTSHSTRHHWLPAKSLSGTWFCSLYTRILLNIYMIKKYAAT